MGHDARLRVIDGGRSATDSLADIRAVIDEYVVPATAELKRLADDGDLDGIRALSYELLTLAGTIVSACPRATRTTRV